MKDAHTLNIVSAMQQDRIEKVLPASIVGKRTVSKFDTGEEKMIELRWYQTYDKNGVNSEMTLQYKETPELFGDEWKDVPIEREREIEKEEEQL